MQGSQMAMFYKKLSSSCQMYVKEFLLMWASTELTQSLDLLSDTDDILFVLQVTAVESERVLTKGAYMLFYAR